MVVIDLFVSIILEGASPASCVATAAQQEQRILDAYYKG